mgnify:CR=1 FL=1
MEVHGLIPAAQQTLAAWHGLLFRIAGALSGACGDAAAAWQKKERSFKKMSCLRVSSPGQCRRF